MIKVKVKDPSNILKQLRALPRRLEGVKFFLGTVLSREIKNEVVKRIPNESTWLRLYKDSINFYYDGKEWAVAGERDTGSIQHYDAETTLFSFVPSDVPTRLLAQYNDWPLDMIPALNKPYGGQVMVKAGASKTQVEVRRKAITTALPKIRQQLGQSGYSVNPYGTATFNGRVTADLKYLATRLEEGTGAYPFGSIPHWRPAAMNTESSVNTTLAIARSKIEAILKGDIPARPNPMTPNIRNAIRSYTRKELS